MQENLQGVKRYENKMHPRFATMLVSNLPQVKLSYSRLSLSDTTATSQVCLATQHLKLNSSKPGFLGSVRFGGHAAEGCRVSRLLLHSSCHQALGALSSPSVGQPGEIPAGFFP